MGELGVGEAEGDEMALAFREADREALPQGHLLSPSLPAFRSSARAASRSAWATVTLMFAAAVIFGALLMKPKPRRSAA
jgi:hypothetical protein